MPPFTLSQLYNKLTKLLKLLLEYQNRIIQDEYGRIMDISIDVPGSNLDYLAYRVDLKDSTVRKHRVNFQNAEVIITASFSLENLHNMQPDDQIIAVKKAFWDPIVGGFGSPSFSNYSMHQIFYLVISSIRRKEAVSPSIWQNFKIGGYFFNLKK